MNMDEKGDANANDDANPQVTVTDSTVKRVEAHRTKESNDKLNLRIEVQAGGCSGFEYKFSFDDDIHDDDVVFGGAVVIDTMSLGMMGGAKIDFVEGMIGSDFKITNPNAMAGCGCGHSFTL